MLGAGKPVLVHAAARRGLAGRRRRGDGIRTSRCRRSTPGSRRARSVTALVVDDSTANRRILAGLLESAGVQRHRGRRRPRGDRARAGASPRRRLHGPEDERSRRSRGDAAARAGSRDGRHPGHRRDGERASATSGRRPARLDASTICPSRFARSCCSPCCRSTSACGSSARASIRRRARRSSPTATAAGEIAARLRERGRARRRDGDSGARAGAHGRRRGGGGRRRADQPAGDELRLRRAGPSSPIRWAT